MTVVKKVITIKGMEVINHLSATISVLFNVYDNI